MAAETSSVTGAVVVGAAAAALGPILGPYVVVIVCALGGSFVAITAAPASATLWPGVLAMLRGVIVASIATGMLAQLAASTTGMVLGDLLAPVAFAIGWRTDWALNWLQTRLGGPDAR